MSEAEIEVLLQKVERVRAKIALAGLVPTRAEFVRALARHRGMYVVGGLGDPSPEER